MDLINCRVSFSSGAGLGGSAIRFLNKDTSELASRAVLPGNVGGVRTAAADFTGDGVPDLVVGTGPGDATRVTVYDGVSLSPIFSVAPFEASFTGGVYVAVGDINGDGIPDLIITPDEGGGPRVRIFDGASFRQVADFFGIDDPDFRGGARAAVGDMNGDGKGDLIVAAGFGGGPRVAAFDGAQLGPQGGPKLIADFFAFESSLTNGAFVAVGDTTGDGVSEIIAGGGPGGGPRVSVFDGKSLLANQQVRVADFFAGDPNNRGGIRIATKDFDNDGRADLLTGAGEGDGSKVVGYSGATLLGGAPPTLLSIDAFPGFNNGVYVG